MIALAILAGVVADASADSCSIVSVGLDTTQAHQTIVDTWSDWTSQVFEAPDSVLRSITVWRAAYENWQQDGKLYLMEVKEISGVKVPDPSNVIATAAILQVAPGDSVHAVEMVCVFDPPVILPRRGAFAFEVQPQPCTTFALLCAGGDLYTGGSYWSFDGEDCSGTGCCPGDSWHGEVDIAFRADFCESAVATDAPTWGRLKAGYR
jgi:hypothetical protein